MIRIKSAMDAPDFILTMGNRTCKMR